MNFEQKDRINGCIAVEHAVASIYGSFMKMFPEERGFWEALHNDEVEHSIFLIDTLNLFDGAKLPPDMHPPALPFVVKTLEFANNINFRIRMSRVSLEEALKIALELEETMVEIFINNLISGMMSENKISSSTDFNRVLAAEKEHVTRIRDMMLKKGVIRPS
ncbi:MAG: hypothetical protein HY807_04265 [Nitrospirae bacterium]|nr:hypothetical protein [Nitrospirota bacterium]